MSKTITATEAKAKLLAHLDAVERGEEFEITRHGVPVAKVIPARGPQWLLGRYAGQAKILATDEELFSTGEVWEAS
jgi:prevent-host-death family protein